MAFPYDPSLVVGYFDELAEGEWDRLERDPEAGLGDRVEDRLLIDVVDMSALDTGTFDAVVCYGGVLSYVMDRRGQGLEECVRLTKPGGLWLMSVMSLWGSVHKGLSFVMSVPRESNEAIIASGDITSEVLPGHRHFCHAFRGTEFRALLEEAGLAIEAMSASTCLTTAWGDRLADIRPDDARWAELPEMEFKADRSEAESRVFRNMADACVRLGIPRPLADH